MAKRKSARSVAGFRHNEASRKNIPTAEYQAVMEDGIISERGSHEELLRREGLYADLYRKQLLEQEIAEL